jgi:hypothetical protein
MTLHLRNRQSIDVNSVSLTVLLLGVTFYHRQEMGDGTRERRLARATSLVEKFEKNLRMIEKTVWQDEKKFPLDVPVNLQNGRVYSKGKKSYIPDKNLFSETKKLSKKVMFQPD